MKDKIILFSENTHPFIISELKYASDNYSQIVLLAPFCNELQAECLKYPNVKYCITPNDSIIKKIATSFKGINFRAINELFITIKQRKMSIQYIKLLIIYLYNSTLLNKNLKNILHDQGQTWILLSCWFAPTSYAVSVAKEIYPKLKVGSLAHSYEVDDIKNKCVGSLFKSFCHNNLDFISFISKNVLDTYLTKYVIPNKWKKDHISVDYLGTLKKANGISHESGNNYFHIVSCSALVPVKQIALLIEGLSLIKDLKINWTHIGTGFLLEELQNKANIFNNSNINVEWMGAIDNIKIHEYYANNAIDVFINVSSSEGIPVSIMEAIAYGIPCIATDVGGNSEIVDELIGILLDSNPTPQDISDAIHNFANMDNNRKKNMRVSALKKFEKFNSDKIREDFYKKIKDD